MLASMFPNMSEAEIVQKMAASMQHQTMRMAQMEAAIAAAQAAGAAATAGAAAAAASGGGATGGASGKGGDWHQGFGAWEAGGKGFGKGVVLDEKHFRRCDKFEGNPAKFKSWMFDLATAIEYVDHGLAKDLKLQMKVTTKIEIVNGEFQLPMDLPIETNHAKYKGALYALIVGLTAGEAKCVVRGINEKGWESDGSSPGNVAGKV